MITYKEDTEQLLVKIGRFKLTLTVNPERCIVKHSIKLIKFLDYILPKDKNLVIFNSIPTFSDNAYAYYKYLLKNHPNKYKYVWLYTDTCPNNKNSKNVNIYSFQGIYNLLRAKYIVSTHASYCLDFIHIKNHVLFNVWHGMPLKTLGHNEPNLSKLLFERYKNLGKYSYMFGTSDIFNCMLTSCFHNNFYKTFVTGQPRTDLIWDKTNQEKIEKLFKFSQYDKVVFYMPTYKEAENNRTIGQKETVYNNLFYFDDYNEERFVKYLEEKNILFLMKPHPFDENFYNEHLNTLPKSENFKIIFNEDLRKNSIYSYELFKYIDLMISDFSSVTLDYLILNRPVIYLNNLSEEYQQNRGMILPDNTKLFMPGSKVNNYTKLEFAIERNLYHDEFKAERERILPLIHKYQDNKSSERIYEIMKGL